MPFAQNFAPKVAFLTGDDEYRSEYSMPALAQILEQNYHLKTQQGFDGLKDADLMVLFLRWRQYPEDKLQAILDYEKSGRPIAGFRTSTHAFKYPAGHPREQENDGFPLRVFGAKWTRHHGHLSTTRTTTASSHEILSGVNPDLTLPSWLYTVNPLQGNCQPILTGHAINPQNGRDDGEKHMSMKDVVTPTRAARVAKSKTDQTGEGAWITIRAGCALSVASTPCRCDTVGSTPGFGSRTATSFSPSQSYM